MQTILEQETKKNSVLRRRKDNFGEKIGLFGKLFGCWHKDLSRPFSDQRSSYRACLECGARKHFDAESLKTFGSFYYPPATNTSGKN